MKLTDDAQSYYRLALGKRMTVIEDWFTPEMERVQADFVRRGYGESGILNQALANTILERWQKIVDARIECLVETYEQYELKLELDDVNDFVGKLESSRDRIIASIKNRIGGDPSASLLHKLDQINRTARQTLLLDQKKLELRTKKLKREEPMKSDKYTDRQLMERAIDLARKCISEPGKVSPKVGAIIVRDGVILGEAYRGELEPGDHAEFTLFEKKLADVTLVGATLFTTLEPCTTRNHPKVPCARRVAERGIKKVFIGTLDRNPNIQGHGQFLLQDHGVHVALFEGDLIPVLNEINRDFIRQFTHGAKQPKEALKSEARQDTPSFSVSFAKPSDNNRLILKNDGTAGAKNIRVQDVPLTNTNFADKTITFKVVVPTLGAKEESSLAYHYGGFADPTAENASGIHQDPITSRYLNKGTYTLKILFSDLNDNHYIQELAMDNGHLTIGPLLNG